MNEGWPVLTRVRVRGFKNLVDVDVQLGAFTCIAGLNGVGKSNLFDALLFLKELAERPFIDAASRVRGGQDIANLFTAGLDGIMEIGVEMLIPLEGIDDFGQVSQASSTFLTYAVCLKYVESIGGARRDEIHLVSEELDYIQKGQAFRRLGFPHTPAWRDSVVRTRRFAAFISTDPEKGVIRRHQDDPGGKGGGRTWEFPLHSLPRTVLSSARNAQEGPTAVLARQAILNTTLLQLEPSALRKPDDLRRDPPHLDAHGAHLPATLYRLAHTPQGENTRVYAEIANRLAELISGVDRIWVERDDGRQLLTLFLQEFGGPALPASSLSDGTLRFLTLAVLEADPNEVGILCLEEPENGIHPSRIGEILRLLQDIAVDTSVPIGPDNPLRQVLINTHSPQVVGQVPDTSLLFADSRGTGQQLARPLRLNCIQGTWRQTKSQPPLPGITKGDVLSYLNPAGSIEDSLERRKPEARSAPSSSQSVRTVRDVAKQYLNQLTFPFEAESR